MIMIIDDDKEWIKYYENLLKGFELESYRDCIAAIDRMAESPPDLVLLDILLVGPTGFSILNEMQSYPDLSRVPVFIISSVDLGDVDLQKYGVAKIFNKSTMLPSDILDGVKEYTHARF